MRKTGRFFAAAIALFIVAAAQARGSSEAEPSLSPDQAIRMLEDGNAAFVAGAPKHPNADRERRELTATKGQHPFVAMLSCSDSRVPVELLFDAGVGDIFSVRVAGNVADTDEIGSLEYGVDHLGAPLLVVLGHTHCGAVTAVVEGARLHGNLPPLVAHIAPAVDKVKARQPGLAEDALVDAATRANVWNSIEDALKKSAILRQRVGSGRLKIVGALYDINSGRVEWLGAHPDQDKILAAGSTPETLAEPAK